MANLPSEKQAPVTLGTFSECMVLVSKTLPTFAVQCIRVHFASNYLNGNICKF